MLAYPAASCGEWLAGGFKIEANRMGVKYEKWKSVPHKFLLMPDFPKIKQPLKAEYGSRQGHLGGKFARIFITATDKSGEAASALMDPSAVPCQIGSLPCAP